MRLIIIALGLVLLFGSNIQAQDPLLRHFTIKDGLPGGIVYMCMQDSKGYIWSATERGVTRFDGNEFKLFSIEDGLPCNDVWNIQEDEKGRMWLNTFGAICYIADGKVVVLDDKQFQKSIEKVHHHFCQLGHLVILSNSQKIYALNEEGSVIFNTKIVAGNYLHMGIQLKEKEATALFTAFKRRQGWDSRYPLILVNNTIFSDSEQRIEKLFSKNFHEIQGFVTIAQNKVLMQMSGQLWLLTEEVLQPVDLSHLFPDKKVPEIQRVNKIAENKIWIKTRQHHLITDTLFQPILNLDFLNKYSVNHIFFDQQENLWLSSGHGLFFLNREGQTSSTYSLNGDMQTESIDYLSLNQRNEIWGLSTVGNLYKLEKEAGLESRSLNPIVKIPKDLEFDNQGNLFVGGNNVFKINQGLLNRDYKIDDFQELPGFSKLDLPGALKRIHLNEQGHMLMAMSDRIYSINPFDLQIKTIRTNSRFYGLASKKNGTFWASGKNGLKLFSANGSNLDFQERNNDPIFQLPIDNVAVDSDDNLWIAVNSLGLFRYDGINVESVNELKGVMIASLNFDDLERLWVATNQGIAKIFDIHSSPSLSYKFKWLTEIDGLASNNVKEVILNENKIYAATERGVSVLPDIEKKVIRNNAPFRFSNFQINGSDLVIKESYKLAHDENNVLIKYECLDFKNIGSMFFQHKLDGIDEEWVDTKAFQKEYSQLAPGSYIFRLRRKSNQSLTSSSELVLKFKIKSPFWESSWFIFGMLLFLILFVIYILKYQTSVVRLKAEEENRINLQFAEMELSALQAQLNPHFVSNALQAIQGLIFKKDERIANRYLVKFSRLMRLFLESSKEKYIALQDELQLLKIYIELEQLRFKDQFSSELKINKELEFSMIKIPTMLLQPFIENAINHGLIHRKTPGRLLIAFTKKNKKLHCRIEDNGIGRKKAMALKENSIKSYKSRGIQLVEERQKAWNALGNAPIDISIEDLYDSNNEASGTRVNLAISIEN